ncbi:glycoside hydrolase family 105 protein [Clostridium estertheticum]|uniref:glycoside hydrolase family 88/105 protein n=1 Tax=Clostridium estertheticum TaxID=238834 RepID=UPI001CF5C07C|nr:glycoside hydrolase family 105 protein [Clostridium estertheticum]MCB2353752.1 glycoside hydrolase family 105 protein [Clostridium estertheticum]WAG40546.1 glycoside hydrolase family 105 protein [Clostridium estertheticum]
MKNYAKWMADSVIERNTNLTDHWGYEYGLTLDGIAEVWKQTGDEKYLDYIVEIMDHFVQEDGNIIGYRLNEYNIDHLNNGKILITLYKETGNEKYKKALELLKKQIETQPRTTEGAFWHKNIYPSQIWLDGLYMGATFYAKYIKEFGEISEFNDIAHQFIICEKNLKDEKTGLLYHAFDEKKEQNWANKETGLSPHFWSRAMGWYVMALVDTLEVFPEDNENREKLISILNNCMTNLIKVEDKESHVWYQVLDEGQRKGNYLEASGSSMIVYALLKGVRKGYLPKRLKKTAKTAYEGLINEFILETKEGLINLNKICYVAGLGGKEKRDGSFAYYISEPIVSNEPKGLGPFILASAESQLL